MIKKFKIIILRVLLTSTLSFFLSCQDNKNTNPVDSKFEWFDNSTVTKKSKIVLSESKIINIKEFDKNKMKLSSLIDNFHFLKLNDTDSDLIGQVDKIIFNDEYIFIMDMYNTESIQVFNKKTGEKIFVINNHGKGPGEFISLYDFIVNFKTQEISLFDGSQSKCLTFDFQGKFKYEKRLPFRVGNIRKISSESYANFTRNSSNEHLGNFYSNKDIIISDSNFIPTTAEFKYSPDIIKNDYFSRDYFRKNNEKVSYFPRYKNDIFEIEENLDTIYFNKIIEFNLDNFQINEDDFMKETSKFFNDRISDNKIFSNGSHGVTKNWIFASYQKYREANISVFHNRREDITYGGSEIEFDIENLPTFGFPFSANGEECVTVVDPNLVNAFKNLSENQKNYYKEKKLWSLEFENLINSIEDVEKPLLLFYTLKN